MRMIRNKPILAGEGAPGLFGVKRPRWLLTLRSKVAALFNFKALTLGLCATAPLFTLALATGSLIWLRAALLTVSLVLGWLESSLTLLGVLAQAAAIIGLAFALVACRPWPLLFSLICAAAAAGTVGVAGTGARLKTLAAFTFIPGVYFGFDLSNTGGYPALPHAIADMPILAGAAASAVVLVAVTRRHRPIHLEWRRLFIDSSLGPPRPYRVNMVAAALSVGAVTMLATALPIRSGQWAVWSALSIVMADAGAERRKLRDRALGATIGVPVGLAFSLVLPHASAAAPSALLASMLTLIGIRHYLTGVLLRWGLVAFAATAGGSTPFAGLERTADVIVGGLLGLGALVLVRLYPAQQPASLLLTMVVAKKDVDDA